jgi:predicted kinase
VIALDGPRGAGKSTLAAALRLRTGAAILATDDLSRAGLSELIRRLPPAGVIVLDAPHSAGAELADLVQLAVYVVADTPSAAVRSEPPPDVDLRVSRVNYATRAARN